MARRDDLHKIMIIGSGPIVIGLACEFDYSGAQACKALKQEGYEVILINSNPATIMTDPNMADKTYIEPVTPDVVEKIIARERPDALLPTMGGQTALNVALDLSERGILKKYNVELIGANERAIKLAENRSEFKDAMVEIGLENPRAEIAYNMEEAWAIADKLGFPCIVRPSLTMGGMGGGIVYNREEFEAVASKGLLLSPISEIIIDESLLGWQEFEIEVIRDRNDKVIVVCSIENLDPMGIHTGDSITVAPAQTLTFEQYGKMRDASIAMIRKVGVTGGSNMQFAINPDTGRMLVIEMNPRVSRSSALASKATGYPIAKVAAKLSIGYSLDEIMNDITKNTLASVEPTIDYVVTKIPRFAFEKFPEADSRLGVQMKAVGEIMSIGRTFKESLQKGLRGLEIRRSGFETDKYKDYSLEQIKEGCGELKADRIFFIRAAFDRGVSVDEIYGINKIDKWFLSHMKEIVDFEKNLHKLKEKSANEQKELLTEAKVMGFSDAQIAALNGIGEEEVREIRKKAGVVAVYKSVDTCAAEHETFVHYYYSTYEKENESISGSKRKIMILGGGPNRIGQGIEFDYCCCHAAYALKELDIESVMVNSNPETVSTDYDTSDKLYFDPLTFEDVMNIIDHEKPDGIIVQFGGQTPLNLARRLRDAGAKIVGTSVESIERAESREEFSAMCTKLGIKQPANGMANTPQEAIEIAERIGYPILLRPSFVLGGRGMRIIYSCDGLDKFVHEAKEAGENRPVLIDKFIQDAIEVDVDAVSDGKESIVCGILEHIEEAGIHSGDSACVLPPHTLPRRIVKEIKKITEDVAKELNVIGLMNIQFAIEGNDIYIVEVNPRASRTVPFVSKATGVAWAKIAAKVMAGVMLKDIPEAREPNMGCFAVKESVLPFNKFPGSDPMLGPEMKSTGEVMGIDKDLGIAYIKAQEGAYNKLPKSGAVFLSVRHTIRRHIVFMAKKIHELGFEIYSTEGTANMLNNNGIPAVSVPKVGMGKPDIVDMIKANKFDLLINIPEGQRALADSKPIRTAAVLQKVSYITTLEAAQVAVAGMDSLAKQDYGVKTIQEYVKETTFEPKK